MEFWKLNLKEIGTLKIIWELEFWKLNLGIEVLEIKFEINWSFENGNFGKLFENRNFENWNFKELFENGISKK